MLVVLGHARGCSLGPWTSPPSPSPAGRGAGRFKTSYAALHRFLLSGHQRGSEVLSGSRSLVPYCLHRCQRFVPGASRGFGQRQGGKPPGAPGRTSKRSWSSSQDPSPRTPSPQRPAGRNDRAPQPQALRDRPKVRRPPQPPFAFVGRRGGPTRRYFLRSSS